MKNIFFQRLLIVTLLLTAFSSGVKSQTKPAKELTYKDYVGDNPNAVSDLKLVGDYINALVAGDMEKAKNLMIPSYKGTGPGPADSTTADQTIASWTADNKMNSDRKIDFVTQTFRVFMGDLKGDYVSMWGTYSFTQNGKMVKIPYQYTAKVANGKIESGILYYDRLNVVEALGYKVTPPAN